MGCTDFKIKDTCNKSYAVCVSYEGNVPDYSALSEESCLDIQQVAEDLYQNITDIKESLDFESLTGDCIDYPTGELSLLQVLTAMQNKICELEQNLTDAQNTISQQAQQITDLENNICQ